MAQRSIRPDHPVDPVVTDMLRSAAGIDFMLVGATAGIFSSRTWLGAPAVVPLTPSISLWLSWTGNSSPQARVVQWRQYRPVRGGGISGILTTVKWQTGPRSIRWPGSGTGYLASQGQGSANHPSEETR